ncbi:hypothetical protein C9382_06370 [Pseudomonas aylmerensis]|uniref:Uncharacterized protein n=1 Tax=Pseudomonas aylmerensis TaxID=1869229 RepID=A0A2T4G7L7_9PSED|nr:hypothetical protein C9382_06370 [Pseudomonas aylmerensis]
MGCEAALKPHTTDFLKRCGGIHGGASHPNAGQACSPQQPVEMAVIGNACERLDLKGIQIYYLGTDA